jgi:hypothetical protein
MGKNLEHHGSESSLTATTGGETLADYTPARLRIGGTITHDQYLEIQRLTVDGAEVSVGQFYEIGHDRARGGEFEELEEYLIKYGIAFDRYSEPALGYDGRLAQFRTGMGAPVEFIASGDNQERVVPVSAITLILSSHRPNSSVCDELAVHLMALCGPVLSPLPEFSVWGS